MSRGVAGFGKNLFGRPALGNPAMIHENDAGGNPLRKCHLVGHDQQRYSLLRQFRDCLQHLLNKFGIERRGYFVQEHEFWIHGKRAGNSDSLLLTARQLRGVVQRPFLEPHAAEPRQRQFLSLGFRQAPHLGKAKHHIPERRQMRK